MDFPVLVVGNSYRRASAESGASVEDNWRIITLSFKREELKDMLIKLRPPHMSSVAQTQLASNSRPSACQRTTECLDQLKHE